MQKHKFPRSGLTVILVTEPVVKPKGKRLTYHVDNTTINLIHSLQ
jgi:hypothetical protein